MIYLKISGRVKQYYIYDLWRMLKLSENIMVIIALEIKWSALNVGSSFSFYQYRLEIKGYQNIP